MPTVKIILLENERARRPTTMDVESIPEEGMQEKSGQNGNGKVSHLRQELRGRKQRGQE